MNDVDVFLNTSIRGGNLGNPMERRFFGWELNQAPTIEVPGFIDPRFFEAIPTAWTHAYIFSEAIRARKTPYIEELAALVYLFLKHKLEPVFMDLRTPAPALDPQLPPALNGTYPDPDAKENPRVEVLVTKTRVVVGGYYPPCVFFPAANRARWIQDENVRRDLADVLILSDSESKPKRQEIRLRLSTENLDKALPTPQNKEEFRRFFLQVIMRAKDKQIYNACHAWAQEILGATQEDLSFATRMAPDLLPQPWPTSWNQQRDKDTKDFKSAYPLVKKLENDIKLYLMLTGLEQWNPKLQGEIPSLGGGVTLFDFKYDKVRHALIVDRPGYREHPFPLEKNAKVVVLKDYLLASCGYWVTESKHPLEGKVKADSINLRWPKPSQKNAGCLIPVKSEFLSLFGNTLDSSCFDGPEDAGSAPSRVRWSLDLGKVLNVQLNIQDSKVYWEVPETGLTNKLKKVEVALWPPTPSEQWRYYAAYVRRDIGEQNTPFVSLIPKNGSTAQKVQNIESDKSRQIVALEGDTACYPTALSFADDDKEDSQRQLGVLYLSWSDQLQQNALPYNLVVDLGTSNTALGFQQAGDNIASQETEPLRKFNVVPERVWGNWDDSGPGNQWDFEFVPRKFAEIEKGFFSTALIVPANMTAAAWEEITCADLLRVCVPALQEDLMDAVFNDPDATLKGRRRLVKDLKWSMDDTNEVPFFRALFLGHILLLTMAELYFNNRGRLDRVGFTFPLAFSDGQIDAYRKQCVAILNRVTGQVLHRDLDIPVELIDESTAAAASAKDIPKVLNLIVDVGGGTTDIAIRAFGQYEVLESIRVAGRHFFAFTERNVPPSSQDSTGMSQWQGPKEYKAALKALKYLLAPLSTPAIPSDDDLAKVRILSPRDLTEIGADFSLYYSLMMGRLKTTVAMRRENQAENTLKEKASYQAIRGSAFFRHLILFSLLQGCGVVIEKKGLIEKIDITLGGNAWRLLYLAGMRFEKSDIREDIVVLLDLIKGFVLADEVPFDKQILEKVEIGEVTLLGEDGNEKAVPYYNSKTRVCLNALDILSDSRKLAMAKEFLNARGGCTPFTGIGVMTDQGPMAWHTRWEAQQHSDAEGHEGRRNAALARLRGPATGGGGKEVSELIVAGLEQKEIPSLMLSVVCAGELLAKLSSSRWDHVESDLLAHRHRDKRYDQHATPLKWFIQETLYPKTLKDSLIEQALPEVL